VSFNVATSGNYKLTIITNADSYKENFLYLDENSAGTLYTSGNKWEAFTQTVYLTPGEHKYGVSTDWGHTALDYVIVEPESTSSSNGMYVRDGRLYDADGKEYGRYNSIERKNENIRVEGNYVKIIFEKRNGSNYYGYKATVTPNYE